LAGKGFPKPDYPLEARRRGEAGTVIVELEIRADGSIGEIRVLRDPGYPMLREAALAAAEKLRGHRFSPATLDGRPIEYPAPIRYEFSLR
jgi:TonB family protein